MDNLQIHKKKEINNYINSIDLTNIDVNRIKNELHSKLGETPGVKLNYMQEELIMEDGKSKKKLEKLESISITYTYIKQISDGDGGYYEIPVPCTETFKLV